MVEFAGYVLVWGFLLKRRLEPTPGAVLLLMAVGYLAGTIVPFSIFYVIAKRWATRIMSVQLCFLAGALNPLLVNGAGLVLHEKLQWLDFTPAVQAVLWGYRRLRA